MRVTRSADDGLLDERAKAYLSYWSAFSAFLRDKQGPFKLTTPRRGSSQSFGNIGRTGFQLYTNASVRDRRLSVGMFIEHPAAKRAFDLLKAQGGTIELEFGAPLVWGRMDDRKSCYIAVLQYDRDPNVEADRPRQFEWLLGQMERFTGVFRGRVKALPLDGSIDTAPPPIETVADG